MRTSHTHTRAHLYAHTNTHTSMQGVLTLFAIFVKDFFRTVYWPLGDVLDIVALLNNSINFLLYCTMSGQFRRTFVDTFGIGNLGKYAYRQVPRASATTTTTTTGTSTANPDTYRLRETDDVTSCKDDSCTV